MKLLGMDKELKQNFMGGIAGSLTFFMEQAAYEMVPSYTTSFMGQKIDPNVPRNGQLVATLGPLAVAWASPKIIKRHLSGNATEGIYLYDGPKLLRTVVTNIARGMGGTQSLPMNLGNNWATNRLSRTPMVMPSMMTGGNAFGTGPKFRLATPTVPTAGISPGIGKYKLN